METSYERLISLEDVERKVQERFPDLAADLRNDELTVFCKPVQVRDVLQYLSTDPDIQADWLIDLSGVHWPAGDHEIERQPSTTGWPTYRVSRDQGVIEVNYIVRSIAKNVYVRVAVQTPDEAPTVPSVTDLFPTANWHEREVFDFFGVEFEGHPDLQRILMPEDWVGHPQRKDYPLGGIDIPYKNDKFIPPPDERELREVVE